MSHGFLSPHWDWRNIKAGLNEADAALLQTSFFRSEALGEINRDAYYGAAGLIMVLAVFAIVAYKSDIGNYRRLKDTARLTFLTHVMFFLVFLVTSVPYSVAMLRIFFAPLGPAYLLQAPTLRCMSFPLGFQLVLYAYEGACRAVIHINYFLVLHHVMFCTVAVLAFQAESLFFLKICIITSCFATYEVLLYAALISRKVQALRRYFQCLTVLGLTLYGVTRLLQTAMLISLFVYGFEPMSHTSRNSALYWVGLCMCVALSALQLYTFVIYKSIWRSTTAKAAMHSNTVPSVLKRRSEPDQAANFKSQMVRSETLSSELPAGVRASSVELTRSNLMATNSTELGIYSSQTLLLDSILEDMPHNLQNSMFVQAADNKV